MKTVGFYVIYSFIWLLTLLPLRVLYIISDGFYQIVFYILKYRRDVVADNLHHAFPEKTGQERFKIEKDFYHHFCDSIFESFKVLHLSKAEIDKRFIFLNLDILDEYYKKGQNVVLISGHYGNWEWMVGIDALIQQKFLAIYKPLSDEKFNGLIKSLREKFAGKGEMVAMNDVYKVILKYEHQQQLIITWFLGDQSPPKDYPLWVNFMNRETPFYSGPEKIARKFGHAVVFMNIYKVKRGYYEVEFVPLFDDPKSTSENEITLAYVKMLEDTIRKEPAYWLWSHRRWKHTR
jgi:KDO2-lipid IV(A) lauroyltransferase